MPQDIVTNEGVLALFSNAELAKIALFIFFTVFVLQQAYMVFGNRAMSRVNREWSSAIRELSGLMNIHSERDQNKDDEILTNVMRNGDLIMEQSRLIQALRIELAQLNNNCLQDSKTKEEGN